MCSNLLADAGLVLEFFVAISLGLLFVDGMHQSIWSGFKFNVLVK
jgi:hypothetical protein